MENENISIREMHSAYYRRVFKALEERNFAGFEGDGKRAHDALNQLNRTITNSVGEIAKVNMKAAVKQQPFDKEAVNEIASRMAKAMDLLNTISEDCGLGKWINIDTSDLDAVRKYARTLYWENGQYSLGRMENDPEQKGQAETSRKMLEMTLDFETADLKAEA